MGGRLGRGGVAVSCHCDRTIGTSPVRPVGFSGRLTCPSLALCGKPHSQIARRLRRRRKEGAYRRLLLISAKPPIASKPKLAGSRDFGGDTELDTGVLPERPSQGILPGIIVPSFPKRPPTARGLRRLNRNPMPLGGTGPDKAIPYSLPPPSGTVKRKRGMSAIPQPWWLVSPREIPSAASERLTARCGGSLTGSVGPGAEPAPGCSQPDVRTGINSRRQRRLVELADSSMAQPPATTPPLADSDDAVHQGSAWRSAWSGR